MAMGVRYGESEWKQQGGQCIEAKRPEIDGIFKEYGVPIVDDSFAAAKP